MDYDISVNRENTTSIPRERTSNASLVKRIKILVHDFVLYYLYPMTICLAYVLLIYIYMYIYMYITQDKTKGILE